MKLIRMSPAAFIHFGTTKELRELMTERMEEFCYLGWSSHIHTNRAEQNFAVSNSYVSPAAEIGVGSYLEDSMIRHKSQIGEECVISGVTLDGQAIPDHTVLHGLKLLNGKFVVRMYGVSDNPKEASLFGKELPVPLWEAPIYPVCASMEEAVHQTLEAWKEGFPIWEDGISLKDSFNQADLSALLPWQEKVSDKVELEEILEAIDRKENLTRLVEEMRDGISERIKAELLKEAQRLSETELEQFSRKIRIYYVLSCFEEKYMDSCFATISSGILAGAVKGLSYDADAKMGKDQVTVNLPVRVNWGGGWSDTPPYCMEHGGTVLNAAVMLDGNCPIEVVVKKVDEPVIVLASADSGAEQTFTDISSLQDSSNPYDPFALHKAALIACGVIPYKEPVSVQEITKNLGSGLYLSTQVINIPRGSGLGTSSILAGACVKALYEMLGKEVTDEELYDRVLCMEQIMSTGGGWQDQVGEFTYGVNANLATISSEVKEMEGARIVNDLSDFVYFDKGQPMWSYYGYKYLGVNPEDGSAIYYDKDKSGTIDDKDKVYLGSAIPDFTYGITLNAAYKGFDLTVFGSGSHGGLLSLYGARLTPSANKPSELWTDSWDVKGAGAKYPHPDPIGDTASRNSSMWLKSGSYFKIKQIQLGYTLPSSFTKKIAISRLRVYVSLDNFFCITPYWGMDPEAVSGTSGIGMDNGDYPTPKTLTFGANLSF